MRNRSTWPRVPAELGKPLAAVSLEPLVRHRHHAWPTLAVLVGPPAVGADEPERDEDRRRDEEQREHQRRVTGHLDPSGRPRADDDERPAGAHRAPNAADEEADRALQSAARE